MKTVYETPSFSIDTYQVKEAFLLSAPQPTPTTVQYDPTEGWSPIVPPRN